MYDTYIHMIHTCISLLVSRGRKKHKHTIMRRDITKRRRSTAAAAAATAAAAAAAAAATAAAAVGLMGLLCVVELLGMVGLGGVAWGRVPAADLFGHE